MLARSRPMSPRTAEPGRAAAALGHPEQAGGAAARRAARRAAPGQRAAGRALEAHPVVWVCATAGAGKTTAVVEATDGAGRPVAWLTLDDTDAAPGPPAHVPRGGARRRGPASATSLRGALAAGIPHAEAAGLLAEAPRARLVLVVDGLERLADAAEALAGPRPRSSATRRPRCASCSSAGRRQLDLGPRGRSDAPRRSGEGTLAFTAEEAAQALATRRHRHDRPAARGRGHRRLGDRRALRGVALGRARRRLGRRGRPAVRLSRLADPRPPEPADRDFLETTRCSTR